jgi:Uma2 family endonuclease
MSTVTATPKRNGSGTVTDQRVVLRGISWSTYERLVAEVGDQSVRLNYDRGILELMCPSPLHDRYKLFFHQLVMNVVIGLRIPTEAGGEARWVREAAERGLEADGCYFLSAKKMGIVEGRAADKPGDPVPDLAIEIDLSDPKADRASIFAALGVPEVWQFDGVSLRIQWLTADGTYVERGESQFLPLRVGEIRDWIQRAEGKNLVAWSIECSRWVEHELVPRWAARHRDSNGGAAGSEPSKSE